MPFFFFIDDTNIRKELLYWYIDAARSYDYFVVLVEPKTTWRYSISDLMLKTHHQVSKEILEGMWSKFDQIIAKYYGWFLSENGVQTLKDRMFEVVDECCETITPSFKDDFQKVDNGQDDKEQGKFSRALHLGIFLSHCSLMHKFTEIKGSIVCLFTEVLVLGRVGEWTHLY